jgi:YHS domain-containing protein
MRRNFIALFLITIFTFATSVAVVTATGQKKTTTKKVAAVKTETTPAAATEEAKKPVTNTLCPVSGGPVSEKYRADYKGQYVYVCCEGCLKEFQADPEKFVAKMSKEERELIKTNELCPMSKEPVSKEFWSEDNGRKVYFCCAGCKATFDKKAAANKKS